MFKTQNFQNVTVKKLFCYFEMKNTRYERRENSSTFVESIRQIHPSYAKQSQFWLGSNQRKLFDNKVLKRNAGVLSAEKQTQFKANLAQTGSYCPDLDFVRKGLL